MKATAGEIFHHLKPYVPFNVNAYKTFVRMNVLNAHGAELLVQYAPSQPAW